MSIPGNQILVVTGDPRSGTSLMMKTLKLLGVPIAGNKWPQLTRHERRLKVAELEGNEKLIEHLKERISTAKERAQKMNPRGFYEIGGVVMRGTNDMEKYGGRAIKICSPGAWPNNRHPRVGTKPENVYKWIWCIRDPASVATSQQDIAADNIEVVNEDGEWEAAQRPANPARYASENGELARWFEENPEHFERCLVVDYDEFMANPDIVMHQIIEFVGIEDPDLGPAFGNIDPKLRRSPGRFTAWPTVEIQDMANAAYSVYEGVKSRKLSQAVAGVDKATEHIATELKSNTKYYDNLTGMFASHPVHERLRDDAPYREEYLKNAMREFLAGDHPECSPLFRPLEKPEQYTLDLGVYGKLTRDKVTYDGTIVTWEEAWYEHQRLRRRNRHHVRPMPERKALADRIKE